MKTISTESRYDKNDRLGKAFPDFVEKLAFALGAGLPVGTNDTFGEIPLKDCLLSLRLDGYSGRVEVGVGNKRDSRNVLHTAGDVRTHEERTGKTPLTLCITIAAEGRSFMALAADIKRRLLPDAVKLWARIEQSVNRSNDYANGCARVAQGYAALLGCTPHQNDSTRAEKNFFPEALHGVNCVTVSEKNVSFKFSGSPDIAARVLEILKSLS